MDVVKSVELKLDQDFRVIGDPLLLQILRGLLRNGSRILVEGLAGRQKYVAEDVKDLVVALDLDKSGRHIRFRDHIRLVDLRISEVGCIEADALLEDLV